MAEIEGVGMVRAGRSLVIRIAARLNLAGFGNIVGLDVNHRGFHALRQLGKLVGERNRGRNGERRSVGRDRRVLLVRADTCVEQRADQDANAEGDQQQRKTEQLLLPHSLKKRHCKAGAFLTRS